jgi:uncharacterized membrane protein YagU involved in acid resistance
LLHPFYVRDAIIAGSTGRIVMILLIYGGPFIRLPNIDVISILGSLATENKQAAITLGGAIHFTMGIVFALIYALLWSLGIGSATWWWGLIFGAIHGTLVLLLLALIILLYPRLSRMVGRQLMIDSGATASGATQPLLPQVVGRPLMMVTVLINHMVFGLVVALVYTAQR